MYVSICVLCESFSIVSSNLFPFDAVNFAAVEFGPIPIDFSERRRIFGYRWWHHGSSGNSRLVVCLINTMNSCGVSRLEC